MDVWYRVPRGEFGRRARRRAVVEHFLNGDWTSRVIEHYCPDGCCADSDTALENMIRLLPKALLPHSATRMAQHRWTRLR